MNPAALAAAHAIGQSAAIIHSATHCIGLPLYGALAVAYNALGFDAAWDPLEGRAAGMYAALRDIAVEDEANPARINWMC